MLILLSGSWSIHKGDDHKEGKARQGKVYCDVKTDKMQM